MKPTTSFIAAAALLCAFAESNPPPAACLAANPPPDTVRLETSAATAEVSPVGARVLSFKKRGGKDVLWRPRAWSLGAKKWTHGGIPPCWPWFGSSGPETNSPIHGFAHRCRFEERSRKFAPNRAELVLGLKPDAKSRKAWPHDFDLEIKFVLTDTLQLEMKTTNTGSAPFDLTCGFHPYFAIGERNLARVTNTDGMRFCDSRETTQYDGVWRGDMKLTASFDHVFVEPKDTAFHAIVDSAMRRRIGVRSVGAARLVVWNPGAEEPADANPEPGCLAAGDWRRLVCVEPAILWNEAARRIEPGKSHVLFAEISTEDANKD